MNTSKNDTIQEKIKKITLMLGIAAALMLSFNYLTNGIFFTPRNFTLLLKQGSVLMIVASGMMFLLIEKNFDLSAGAAVYFTSVFLSTMIVKQHMNVWLAIVLTIVVGLILGMMNGFFIGIVGVPAFIATLAGQLIFRGLGYTWTDAATISPVPNALIFLSEGYINPVLSIFILIGIGIFATYIIINNYQKLKKWESNSFNVKLRIVSVWVLLAGLMWALGSNQGIPMGVVFASLVAGLTAFVANRTSFGRHLYIIGGNTEAAKMAGINIKKRVFQSYLYMGLIYAMAGIILTGRLGGVTATSGDLLELDAVAAASIGGVSMTGGVGRIPGVVFGVIILASIDNVMSLMNTSSYFQMIVKGIILITSVGIDIFMNRKKFQLVKKEKK